MVRDDLHPGGTKARVFAALYREHEEIVYASPAEGAAQTALAQAAADAAKRATILVAKRNIPHARSQEARRLGAKVLQVSPGHLSVVQARARAYATDRGAYLLPFGGDIPQALELIADAARLIDPPEEVWCASGSGVLMRALSLAWPNARRHAVQVGRTLAPRDVAGAMIHVYPKPYAFALVDPAAPFPADHHYEAKAWRLCRRHHTRGADVLFWNVVAPPGST